MIRENASKTSKMTQYHFEFQNNVDNTTISEFQKKAYGMDVPIKPFTDIQTYIVRYNNGDLQIKSRNKNTKKLHTHISFQYDTRQFIHAFPTQIDDMYHTEENLYYIQYRILNKKTNNHQLLTIHFHYNLNYCDIHLNYNTVTYTKNTINQDVLRVPLKLGYCIVGCFQAHSVLIIKNNNILYYELFDTDKQMKYFDIMYQTSPTRFLNDHHSMFMPVIKELKNKVKQRELHRKAMVGIIRSTHCKGCEYNYNVCFFGYVGQYCNKSCWKSNYTGCDEDDEYEEDTDCYSKAHSKYHSWWYSHCSKNGYNYWPMCDLEKPCNNTCIKTKKTILIRGYNAY